MSAEARRAGKRLARITARHTRQVAHRAVESRSNDIGEVIKSDGKGRVTVMLPGVGVSVTETDLYFGVDPSTLEVGDLVTMVAVDNEYVLVGAIESDGGTVAARKTTKGSVIHGTDANKARPKGYPSVEWIGSAEPLNAEEHDTWIST